MIRLYPLILALAGVLWSAPAHALLVCLDAGAPINESTGQIQLNAAALKATGTQYVRVNFILGPWSNPNDATKRGPQNMSWKQTYDQIIHSLTSQGIEVYALIGAQAVHSSAGGNYNSDQWVNDYVANFTTIVGQFKDRVRVYESFNEPNDWAGGTTAQVQPFWFAKMLQNIYLSVKINNGHQSDQSWQVTLVSGPGFSHDMDTVATYMQQTYQAGINQLSWTSVKNSYGTYPLDGIGYHIYVAQGSTDTTTVRNAVNKNLNAIWSTVKSFEGSNTPKKLWVSEWSWNTASVSESGQASNLTTVFNLFKSDARVALASWFQITDFGASDKWGLFRAGGLTEANKKPSWQAFHDFAGAQNTPGSITGTVRDTLGNYLQGVQVTASPGAFSTTTAADGSYTLSNIPVGTYTVAAQKFGYRPGSQAVNVTSGTAATTSFVLGLPATVTSPAGAKQRTDGSFVRLDNAVVTANFAGDRIYIEAADRSSGIGVTGAQAAVGDRVNVTGTMVSADGERVFTSAGVQVVASGQPVPFPLSMRNSTLGGESFAAQGGVVDNATTNPATPGIGRNNVGLLVTTWGNVTFVDGPGAWFYIDDGSGLKDGSGHVGVRVAASGLTLPAEGNLVRITGISGVTRIGSNNARIVRARQQSDIVRLYPQTLEPIVGNASFEDGALAPWSAYGSTDNIITGTWFGGITAHSGNAFAGTATNGGVRSGGYYQTVAVEPGTSCVAKVWSAVFRAANSTTSTLSRIGIDPSGGTNPASANIAWSAWDMQSADYTFVWRQLQTPAVTSISSTVTIFLDFQQSESAGWHVNCFDDATLEVH